MFDPSIPTQSNVVPNAPSSAVGNGVVFSCDKERKSSALPPFYFELRAKIQELGLADFGLAPVGDAPSYDVFLERVRSGYCANLSYLTDEPEKRRSPRSALATAETLVVVALSEARLRKESEDAIDAVFNAPELAQIDEAAEKGAVLGYATCLDYHDVLRKKLKALAQFFKTRFPDADVRAVVDTAPLLEKDWATVAGLGFVGMHSLLIAPGFGSRVFLGELLVSTPFVELSGFATSESYLAARNELRVQEGGAPMSIDRLRDRCLTCKRCVDGCPTNAISGDRTLDARKCLNYWTIENRDEIPDEIAQKLQGRLFGCDLCQRLCPWNAQLDQMQPRELPLDAVERLDDATFRKLFKKTPIFRATVEGLRRVSHALRHDDVDARE